MPKVSVVIPTYNSAQYIAQTIDSVLNQTYTDFEVIVVNDGSTDNTDEIVKPYLSKIKYFYQNNVGVSKARNKGIREANGEYIVFLDSDDLLLRDSISKRMNLVNKYPSITLAFSDYYLEDLPNKAISIPYLKGKNFLDKFASAIDKKDGDFIVFNNSFFKSSVINNLYIHISSTMIKKDVFESSGLFCEELNGSEDSDFLYRAINKSLVGFVDIPLTIYKRFRGSFLKNKFKAYIESIKYLKKLLSVVSKNKEMKSAVNKRISDFHYWLGDYYIVNGQRTVAISTYLKGVYFNKRSWMNWSNLLKACLLPKKLRYTLEKLKNAKN